MPYILGFCCFMAVNLFCMLLKLSKTCSCIYSCPLQKQTRLVFTFDDALDSVDKCNTIALECCLI